MACLQKLHWMGLVETDARPPLLWLLLLLLLLLALLPWLAVAAAAAIAFR